MKTYPFILGPETGPAVLAEYARRDLSCEIEPIEQGTRFVSLIPADLLIIDLLDYIWGSDRSDWNPIGEKERVAARFVDLVTASPAERRAMITLYRMGGNG